jgi:hypothetical protein
MVEGHSPVGGAPAVECEVRPGAAHAGLRLVCTSLAGDQLLTAVDVVGRAREGRVNHDVYGERGNIGRSDDALDGKRGAKLIAAVFELIAEERCRQRCVDEAGGDEVDSDGCERQVGCEGGECGGDCRRDPETDAPDGGRRCRP